MAPAALVTGAAGGIGRATVSDACRRLRRPRVRPGGDGRTPSPRSDDPRGQRGSGARRARRVRPPRPRGGQRRLPARLAGQGLPGGPLGRAHRDPADQPVPARQVRVGCAGASATAASSPSPAPTRWSPARTRPPTSPPSTACSAWSRRSRWKARVGITATAVCPGYVRTPLVERQIPDQARRTASARRRRSRTSSSRRTRSSA